YATPEAPKLRHNADVSEDGRWLIIYTYEGTDPHNDLTLIDLTRPGAAPRKLFTGLKNTWGVMGTEGSRFWLTTDLDAPRLRVVSLDVAKANPTPVSIVPEDKATLDGAAIVGGR